MTTTKSSINISKLGFTPAAETEKAILFEKDLKVGRIKCDHVKTDSDSTIRLAEQVWAAKKLVTQDNDTYSVPLWLFAQNRRIQTQSI